jgi:integrase-like protein
MLLEAVLNRKAVCRRCRGYQAAPSQSHSVPPAANAIAERWQVGSERRECLDHLLIVSEAHLRQVLTAYVRHYNGTRPHQGLGQRTPMPRAGGGGVGPIRRRDVLGGLLREHEWKGRSATIPSDVVFKRNRLLCLSMHGAALMGSGRVTDTTMRFAIGVPPYSGPTSLSCTHQFGGAVGQAK